MQLSAEQMHAYYALRAPYYDAVYAKPERQDDIRFLSRYIPEQLKDRTVLEIACGTGYWTQFIAPLAKSVHATDGTAEPLEFAKLRPNAVRTAFSLADAYELPSSLGMFDGAFAGLWFSHIPKSLRQKFLASLHARLRAGAKVVLIDNSDIQCRDFPITEQDEEGNTYQHRELRDGTVHRVLKNFPTEMELAELFAPHAETWAYRQLENFWLFEYTLRISA